MARPNRQIELCHQDEVRLETLHERRDYIPSRAGIRRSLITVGNLHTLNWYVFNNITKILKKKVETSRNSTVRVNVSVYNRTSSCGFAQFRIFFSLNSKLCALITGLAWIYARLYLLLFCKVFLFFRQLCLQSSSGHTCRINFFPIFWQPFTLKTQQPYRFYSKVNKARLQTCNNETYHSHITTSTDTQVKPSFFIEMDLGNDNQAHQAIPKTCTVLLFDLLLP